MFLDSFNIHVHLGEIQQSHGYFVKYNLNIFQEMQGLKLF